MRNEMAARARGKIETNLSLFLSETNWTVKVSGDINKGYDLMNEYKLSDLKKRDSKAMYKNLQNATNLIEK